MFEGWIIPCQDKNDGRWKSNEYAYFCGVSGNVLFWTWFWTELNGNVSQLHEAINGFPDSRKWSSGESLRKRELHHYSNSTQDGSTWLGYMPDLKIKKINRPTCDTLIFPCVSVGISCVWVRHYGQNFGQTSNFGVPFAALGAHSILDMSKKRGG